MSAMYSACHMPGRKISAHHLGSGSAFSKSQCFDVQAITIGSCICGTSLHAVQTVCYARVLMLQAADTINMQIKPLRTMHKYGHKGAATIAEQIAWIDMVCM